MAIRNSKKIVSISYSVLACERALGAAKVDDGFRIGFAADEIEEQAIAWLNGAGFNPNTDKSDTANAAIFEARKKSLRDGQIAREVFKALNLSAAETTADVIEQCRDEARAICEYSRPGEKPKDSQRMRTAAQQTIYERAKKRVQRWCLLAFPIATVPKGANERSEKAAKTASKAVNAALDATKSIAPEDFDFAAYVKTQAVSMANTSSKYAKSRTRSMALANLVAQFLRDVTKLEVEAAAEAARADKAK